MNQDSLKEQEEKTCDAAYDPLKRWKAIQDTITWAEANNAIPPPQESSTRPQNPPPETEVSTLVSFSPLLVRYSNLFRPALREDLEIRIYSVPLALNVPD